MMISEFQAPEQELQITPVAKSYILETAKWAKFFGILGFIGTGFCVLGGISSFFFVGLLDTASGAFNPLVRLGGGFVMFLYLLIALIYFFPAKYLFDFSNKVKSAFLLNDQSQFDLAFEKLKSCFKYIGIWTVVIISIYILIFIFALAGGLLASFIR